ncbi:hypothetical protein HanHA300_Chr15g0557051 [Helianthus annuus]|nr:hypothetical protein HanHA300_Chr15g0557051 [Helianthus annuus]KAJ0472357.1 hypothetical protein HanHA89_Chr15g0606171 [Helianthus annuus]KAJ0647955.1 hypothetical protein HanLR1_Chr15g0567501 [Helianthus annuus]KAJ0651812.1 hypothetical protein HanOQP8_Chr15g0565121 [Helianthus annuus]
MAEPHWPRALAMAEPHCDVAWLRHPSHAPSYPFEIGFWSWVSHIPRVAPCLQPTHHYTLRCKSLIRVLISHMRFWPLIKKRSDGLSSFFICGHKTAWEAFLPHPTSLSPQIAQPERGNDHHRCCV